MRVLVGWDDRAESELIALYLNVGDCAAVVCRSEQELLATVRESPFDLLLLSLRLEEETTSLSAFRAVRAESPRLPIVGACREEEVYHLAAFLREGMRSCVPRDAAGDFVFLLRVMLEAAFDAVRAEAAQYAAEALRNELDAMHRVQAAVLPHEIVPPAGYSLAARCEPSRLRVGDDPRQDIVVAGGDYYDVLSPDADHTTLLIADATGHGLTASLAIVAVDALLRTLPKVRFRNPAAVLAELNRLFCGQKLNRLGGGLVTAICMVIRHDQGGIAWATAGHPVPLLLPSRAASETCGPLPRRDDIGLPLGMEDSATYVTEYATLPRDGRLLLYTDGLTEAGGKNIQFGVPSVIDILRETRALPIDQALDTLFTASHEHAGPRGRGDDTTALILDRLPV